MSASKRKIDVAGLRVGMYVSELDRPWLETPFLFQGFVIRSKNEIDELREHCKSVVIDFEQSDAAANESWDAGKPCHSKQIKSTSKSTPKTAFWRRVVQIFKREKKQKLEAPPKPGDYYQDTVSVADELVVARTLHTGSLQRLMSVLEGVRRGATLRMPDLEVVVDGMVDSVLRNSTAMALLTRMQKTDDYTHAHSLATSMWALVFGRHLGLDRESLQVLGLGGLLLDIGKTKLPPELLKTRGPLNDVAQMHMRRHVDLGLEILRKADSVDKRIIDMVATHHERFDGSGYPRGLKGNQIPVFGRIAGIVDSYAAMSSDRPYARAKSSYDTMREFRSLADKSFQAELVEQFIKAVGIFPAGTLVELNTGEVGVVLKEHRASRLRPEVAVILDANKQRLDDFRIIDLDDQPEETTAADSLWIERGIEPGTYDVNLDDYFL